ncbi:bifunctional indole-3-glycerol-phosphate synthase TrpC/phosphoribosylanthranilate isomerase TrpF [Deinococcus radiophilus]|uniref:N-(5'-phosphoribosyl)anthranilate isomerase n=1 Tax=Deinococcus radiophilus TaxID=32062 RepID=A0A431VPN9_9DEIO|nr:bifunctional indole-3-glycerol-phosphate synthase TrpC/phosphoribosylanthranilate isomerase TrpF [Deinococcus radiophilus]RTR24699.1 bifunctional indole-3-glycerol-phosphate synthase TrpC/phosphoribosylanthranilate isomerase TrpF [Deinococcus radiophilus]UFA51627.1 bifunctional indole-3-glycerol-phosphate synthase TrpC/phosphoribosylanthranilate isomerase TrpF [Deinococcus radiophilus]
MSKVLQGIVARRRQRVPELRERYADLRADTLPRSRRSLRAALEPGSAFILECKSASPSLGAIRPDYRPAELARTYSRYGAAISVLTEPDFFGGDYAHLQTVALATHLPVLCKDFIVDEVQLLAARYHGADAALLMLSVLDDTKYAHLAEVAERLELDILTEVSSETEMERAARLGAGIIGINHRDLRDLSIDLGRSAQLAPLAPAGTLLVAESGLKDNATVRRIAPQVHGFLVGSSLCGEKDVDRAARRLIYGKHKVCGLTTPEAAQTAAAAGAVYGGLIFALASPRRVSVEQASAIIAAAPELDYVAVYTGHDPAEAAALTQALPLHAVQLHGGQDDGFIRALRAALPEGAQVWYALDMAAGQPQPGEAVDRWVLDNGAGGTGQTFDWLRVPTELKSRSLLAGGLNPANARAALQTGVLGLDFNSGLERERGVKDPALIAQAFAAVRQYGGTSAT